MRELTYENQGMKIERVQVTNWENAIIGMRLPMNSEDQSDSIVNKQGDFELGPKDKDLMIRLAKAGTDHSKVLRMIHVSALVKMPMTWWAHYDTYKVGTVAISRSRMHKLTSRILDHDDFFVEEWNETHELILNKINEHILLAQKHKENNDTINANIEWRRALDLLPMTYCQQRVIDLNYQVLLSILGSRYKVERLSLEWNFFCEAFLDILPWLNQIYDATKHKRSLTTEEFIAMSKK
jgi:hypothetical protein